MTRDHKCVGWERQETRSDAFEELGMVAEGEVGAANAAAKECVAGEE